MLQRPHGEASTFIQIPHSGALGRGQIPDPWDKIKILFNDLSEKKKCFRSFQWFFSWFLKHCFVFNYNCNALQNQFPKQGVLIVSTDFCFQISFFNRTKTVLGVANGPLKKFGSRKILANFRGSRSLVFSAVVCVSESRFFDEAVSKSRFLTSRSVSEYWFFGLLFAAFDRLCGSWTMVIFKLKFRKHFFGPFPFGVTMAKTFWQR